MFSEQNAVDALGLGYMVSVHLLDTPSTVLIIIYDFVFDYFLLLFAPGYRARL